MMKKKFERAQRMLGAGGADTVLLEEIRDYKEQLTCPSCKVRDENLCSSASTLRYKEALCCCLWLQNSGLESGGKSNCLLIDFRETLSGGT